MKRILLPTDFSENAFNAVSYAVQLFKEQECRFYLLNTYTPGSYHTGLMMDSYSALQQEDLTRQNSINGLNTTKEKIEKEFPNQKHSFDIISSFNLLVSEILSAIKEHSIDLIVMGTQGATGAKEVFLGTHTMYTIKKVKCPVIAVPSGYTFKAPEKILFATDYRFSRDNEILVLMKEICEMHKSRLNILNASYKFSVTKEQESNRVFLNTYFKEHAHVFHLMTGVDVVEAVETFQIKSKIDFLVMIHNKRSFFDNLLFKPVINNIVYRTEIPFLVVPSKERS